MPLPKRKLFSNVGAPLPVLVREYGPAASWSPPTPPGAQWIRRPQGPKLRDPGTHWTFPQPNPQPNLTCVLLGIRHYHYLMIAVSQTIARKWQTWWNQRAIFQLFTIHANHSENIACKVNARGRWWTIEEDPLWRLGHLRKSCSWEPQIK